MKKYFVLFAGLSLALAFTSCKSSESAYKKAYEKAKSQEAQQRVNQEPVQTVTPVATQPATQTRVTENVDNATVRKEKVTVVDGSGLKAYSVVVGAFSLQSNAQGLCQQLRDSGYDAQIVKNEERGLFRVVATTFDNKADAVNSRNSIRGSQFNPKADAWLLYNE